jgi:small-conductance mechanosensitive channel
MKGIKVCFLRLVFLFSLQWSGTLAFGQANPMDLIKDVLKPAKSANDTTSSYSAPESLSLNQLRNYQAEIGRVNNMLRRRPDSTEIAAFIPRVEALVNGVNEQLNKREVSFNLRMIGSILNFINFSERSLSKYETELENRLTSLSSAKQSIDSIQVVLARPELITDEQRQSEGYNEFLSGIRTSTGNTSIELNKQLVSVLEFDSKIQNIKLSLDELDIQLRFESHRLTNKIFSKEIPYLWQPLEEREPGHYTQAVKNAVFFNTAILFRYLTVFQTSTISFIILTILLIVWFNRTYSLILKDEKNRELIFRRTSYLPKYPRLTAALVLLSLLVLFYPDPPMIIFSAGLFLSGTITGILLFRRVEKPVFVVWVLFYILFVLSLLSNLYWETVYEERFMIFFMSLAGIMLGLFYQVKLKAYTKELPKYLLYIVWIYVGIEVFALVFSLLGRLSLSKMLSVTATVSLMQAFSLFIFVLIIKEFIYLQIELGHKKNADPTSTNDYEKLKNKVVNIFSFVAVGLWLYYFLKNLSLFNVIVEEIAIFLTKPRSLHYATFSFATILTFFLTLYIATFLANNFAYFTEIRDRKYQGHRNKRFGSQVLIVRLVIISVGFFIALAAAGIPIDRITIVLGALSVGIGFGLQTIINNLV